MFWAFKNLFRWLFRIRGWTVNGSIPPGVKKAILVGGAHTSNWDLLATFGTLFTLKKKFHFIVKQEALKFPVKGLLLEAGAIPIARKANSNIVQQVVQFIESQDECYLCISPEGTRSPTKKWKTGCYHMAKLANIPIILCYLDYKKKVAYIAPPMDIVDSEEKTMEHMKIHFQQAVPMYPENFIT